MSQRDSGYTRKALDLYETPRWVSQALLKHIPRAIGGVWEPACGSGKMTDVLLDNGYCVVASDIAEGVDFLTQQGPPDGGKCGAIIANPPYELAHEFIEHALRVTEPVTGLVAMLLRTDFDHAKSRAHLFRDCPAFSMKLVLMKRITWFVEENGKPKASPSFNHAWYIWDWKHEGAPAIGYGP